ncbi:MAG: DUF3054 domain-containing protein [Candidatus Promineofilum sp.]|nr:DUF3054 domain-containing protein [Promineifilum sp.]
MTTNNASNATPQTQAMRQPWWLLAGDWLVLLLFVLIGQRDHAISGPGALPSLLNTAFSLGLPWTAAAFVLGAYRLRPDPGWRQWLGRALNAWLVAAPLGLLLRALLRNQDAIPVTFILVAMSVGGLMIVGWRALAYWWVSRRS